MIDKSSFVCKKHRGEVAVPGGIVYEDELVNVSHGIFAEGESTVYQGLFFVEPRRHVAGWADLSDTEAQRMGLLIQRISRALKESEGADHIYSFVFGHHIDHLHVWVVPRYPGTPRQFWGTAVTDWPGAPQGRYADIVALCERIRPYLQK